MDENREFNQRWVDVDIKIEKIFDFNSSYT